MQIIHAEKVKMACSKLSNTKKRKVDSENQAFKTEWTEKHVFILPEGSTKTLCLICNEMVAIVKSGNIKHHYNTKYVPTSSMTGREGGLVLRLKAQH